MLGHRGSSYYLIFIEYYPVAHKIRFGDGQHKLKTRKTEPKRLQKQLQQQEWARDWEFHLSSTAAKYHQTQKAQ